MGCVKFTANDAAAPPNAILCHKFALLVVVDTTVVGGGVDTDIVICIYMYVCM